MLTEQEKLELREMAQSATLREEFRSLRRYSQQLERRITVDEFMRWLTAMARVLPQPATPRRFVEYKNVKFYRMRTRDSMAVVSFLRIRELSTIWISSMRRTELNQSGSRFLMEVELA